MTKSITDLPKIVITPQDQKRGRLPMVLAEAALKHGPIFRNVPLHYNYRLFGNCCGRDSCGVQSQ